LLDVDSEWDGESFVIGERRCSTLFDIFEFIDHNWEHVKGASVTYRLLTALIKNDERK